MTYLDFIENSYYNEQEIKILIEVAYHKLKADTYHDNSNFFLRSLISENEERIDEIFENVYQIIKYGELKEDIRLGYYCLPKSINSISKKDEVVISNDLVNSQYNIEKITYFIDIDLEYHILGTIWVLLVGNKLLNENSKFIYGRVLDKGFRSKGTKLFKQYYNEYSKWRDNAITHSEQMMDNDNRCLMIALDIKDYYYSVNINFSKLLEELGIGEEDLFWGDIEDGFKCSDRNISRKSLLYRLTEQVKDICSSYSEKIIKHKFKKNILPIGYMPSNLLANWHIKELDINIYEEIRPVYYGRYIDDILMVLPYGKDKTERDQLEIINKYLCKRDILVQALFIKKTDFEEYIFIYNNDIFYINKDNLIKVKEEVQEVKGVIEKILDNISPKDLELKVHILSEAEKLGVESTEIYSKKFELNLDGLDLEKCTEFLKNILQNIKIKSENIEKIYLLKNNLNIKDYNGELLAIQNAKVKVYDFKKSGSKAIIDKFKKEIKENASVFKFLPEKDIVLQSFDEEVYEIKYSDTGNKIGNIESFRINKYNLSKFLAKVIYSEKLDNDSYSKDIEDSIMKLFSGMNIIEFYSMWEKVMICYLFNGNKNYINKIIKKIIDEIDKISIDNLNLKNNLYNHKNIEKDIIDNLKNSLIHYLEITIGMIWSLDEDIFEEGQSIRNISIENVRDIMYNMRYSNLLNHSYVIEPLMNYTNLATNEISKKRLGLDTLNLIKNQPGQDSTNIGFRCRNINGHYNKRANNSDEVCESENCKLYESENENSGCVYELNENSKKYTPRFVHLHEIILYNINKCMAQGKIIQGTEYIERSIKMYKDINHINSDNDTLDKELVINNFNNSENFNRHMNKGKINNHILEHDLHNQKSININLISVDSKTNTDKLRIAIAHMDIVDSDYKNSIMKTPNLDGRRLQKIYKLLNNAVKENANMIVFPELSIPYSWLSVMANFSRKNNLAIICGLEHVVYENNLACNYLATILPGRYNEYTYSIIKLRLKNHYAPSEIEMLTGYDLNIPEMKYKHSCPQKMCVGEFEKEYDLFRWNRVDFSCYNCFELSSLNDRGLFLSYIDLLIGSVHNKDINHYSNIIESLSRDLHCYFVQVNNSKLGDNRVVAPKRTVEKNVLQITGGKNDVLLVGDIDIKKLREFQLKNYNLQLQDKNFKPTPPEFNKSILKLRMNMQL